MRTGVSSRSAPFTTPPPISSSHRRVRIAPSGYTSVEMCETHGMKGAMTLPGFDTRLDAFLQWQASPWGRLRYRVTEANLLRHLDSSPQRVLDVAGRNGLEAVRLAARG